MSMIARDTYNAEEVDLDDGFTLVGEGVATFDDMRTVGYVTDDGFDYERQPDPQYRGDQMELVTEYERAKAVTW